MVNRVDSLDSGAGLSGISDVMTQALVIAGAVVLVAVLAELVHFGKVLRLASLAFGPQRRWMFLAIIAPVFRVVGLGLATWGLCVLLLLPPATHRPGEIRDGDYRHLVLVLDVSRSMEVEDAGPLGKQKRSQRAADLIQSFFERVQAERYKTTVVAFANEAKPVVLDTLDREVVRNILTELPMRHAFKPGDTNLFAGLEEAAKIARKWPPGSAVLMMVSDGDTVPATGMPKMPPSIGSNVVMVGVGNPTIGKALGGHTTRQDVSTLRQVAVRLSGAYHNGNDKQLATQLVSSLDERAKPKGGDKWTLRELAIFLASLGIGFLALAQALLTALGTGWEPGRRISPQYVAMEPVLGR